MKNPLAAWTLLFLCLPALGAEVGGVQVPAEAVLEDGSRLQLNGAGVRSKFFFKIYVGALYLAQPAASAEAVADTPGAKRVSMHFLYDHLSAKKLQDAWNHGFEANLQPARLEALQPRIATFNALFGDVRNGDEIHLDWIPGRGTQVWYGSELRGTVEGDDFYPDLLRIWLGEKPADADLKRAMLGS